MSSQLSKLKSTENLIVLVGCLVVFLLFLNATRINSVVQALDQAYFLESIDTTYENGQPSTMLGHTVIVAIENLLTIPAEKVCAYPFESDGKQYLNLYNRHAQPLFYVLAALRPIFSARIIYYFCALIAFPGLLLVVYLRTRAVGLPAALGIGLLTLVAFHPAWSYSAYGQFYLDKLFPILCVGYFFILHDWLTQDRRRPLLLAIVGILAAATSERSIIMMVAGTLGVYALFGFRRRWSKLDFMPLIFILIIGACGYAYMNFIQDNPDYASFIKSLIESISIIRRKAEAARSIYKFLFINVLLLIPFGYFAKRWTLIAILSLVPNLVGTIGGAEKLGWSTHYHSAYFPFLIVAMVMGATSFWKRKTHVSSSIVLSLSIIVVVIFAFLNPFPPAMEFSVRQVTETGPFKTMGFVLGMGPAAGTIKQSENLTRIAAFIPPGSEVSTLEGYMPALYEKGVKWLHFYPLGLGPSEYLVLPYTRKDNQFRWEGVFSYLGPDVVRQTNDCLQQKVNDQYVLIKEFPESGTAILKRR